MSERAKDLGRVNSDTLETIAKPYQKRIYTITKPDTAGTVTLTECSSGIFNRFTKNTIHHRNGDTFSIESVYPIDDIFTKAFLL